MQQFAPKSKSKSISFIFDLLTTSFNPVRGHVQIPECLAAACAAIWSDFSAHVACAFSAARSLNVRQWSLPKLTEML